MHDITVLDGGMGRELARMGAPFRQPEWSALALMEAPHYVSLAHDAFAAAGADVLTANSYAVVPFHIGEERFRCDGVALAALAGQLARQAADRAARPVRVAGSLPPTGGSYRPDLFDAARADAILAMLVDGLDPYVDLWLAETQSLTDEIHAVRRALGANPKPLWVSFTLRDDVDAGATPVLRSGQTLDEAIDAAVSARATALLFNCSQPEAMGAAIETAQRTLARTGRRYQSAHMRTHFRLSAPMRARTRNFTVCAPTSIRPVMQDGRSSGLRWARGSSADVAESAPATSRQCATRSTHAAPGTPGSVNEDRRPGPEDNRRIVCRCADSARGAGR